MTGPDRQALGDVLALVTVWIATPDPIPDDDPVWPLMVAAASQPQHTVPLFLGIIGELLDTLADAKDSTRELTWQALATGLVATSSQGDSQ